MYDIFTKTVEFWTAQLPDANDVRMGWPDSRIDTTDDSSFPRVLITQYDQSFDENRRIGGVNGQHEIIDDDDVTVKPVGIPLDYHFQLDSLCKEKKDAFDLKVLIERIIGDRYVSFTLTTGEKMYIIPEGEPVIRYEEDITRIIFRYYIQHWRTSTRPAVTEKRVKRIDITHNDSTVEVTP